MPGDDEDQATPTDTAEGDASPAADGGTVKTAEREDEDTDGASDGAGDTAATDDDTADAGDAAGDDAGATDAASEAGDEGDGRATADGGPSDGFDVEAAEARLEEVGKEIEEGRRALADVEQEVEPDSDGPPVAEGEGAANAPPG